MLPTSYDDVGWGALRKHCSTVPLRFLPLDDSLEDVTKEAVKRKVQECLACFSDPNSVMVLDNVESLVAIFWPAPAKKRREQRAAAVLLAGAVVRAQGGELSRAE